MMTLTLLNQIQSHVTLSQHETTEFIQYLINPECNVQDKSYYKLSQISRYNKKN